MLDVILCTTASEPNRIHKTIDNQLTFTGSLREQSSVVNPVINLQGANLAGYNYMYIPAFGRYYYITDITSVRNGLWRITGKCDVLMSFAAQIDNVVISVGDVQETYNSEYLPSDIWRASVKSKTDIISFPSGLNDSGEYILLTSGGVAS